MQYSPPFGAPVVPGGAPYVNGNPVTGTQGSIPPAGSIEYPQREIVNAIVAAGLTPSNNNLSQLLQAIELLGRIPFCQDVGSPNNIVINPAPALTSYVTPLIYAIKCAFPNSGATNINVSGLGGVNLFTGALATLPAATLVAGGVIIVAFDGTEFQLIGGGTPVSGGGGGISVGAFNNLWHYGTDIGTVNHVVVTTDNVGAGWSAGLPVAVLIANNNTGASNIALNGFANVNITRGNGGALVTGDLIAGKIAVLNYDGTQAQLLNPGTASSTVFVGSDVGTANALSVTSLSPTLSTVTAGLLFDITKSGSANTGAATLSVMGTSGALTWADGSPLQAGDWPATVNALVQYNGTKYVILSAMGPAVFQRASSISLFKGADSGTANAINVSSLTPGEASITSGQVFEVTKSSSVNTGACTCTIMGSSGALQWADGTALIAGDWPASTIALLAWNNSVFTILSVMGPSVFARATQVQPILSANATYFLSTAGSDANNGLTSGAPFRTHNHAIAVISKFNLNGFNVTVNTANGTYSETVNLLQPGGSGTITFLAATAGSVIISSSAGSAVSCSNGVHGYVMSGYVFTSTVFTGGSDPCAGVFCVGGSQITLTNCTFGACQGSSLCVRNSSNVSLSGTLTFTGSCVSNADADGSLMSAAVGSSISTTTSGISITIANALSGTYFVEASTLGSCYIKLSGGTMTGYGNFTGGKYNANLNGTINTDSGGSGYYCGTSAGTTSSGGQYL